ncbi:hypothetical protein C8P66_12024 [Humitalea rosea]|uniref:Uncharacterized protein n=1 Tax=Humitalea rosea TaxID=990373 RepID=A0A2W7I572_9PROT|nr:hypothetical protein [Humitalea rosea]PZW41834.1 hypothetical protein C8P66_12024 [Humitalea rosea]
MSPRTGQHLHAIGEALRNLAGGALLAGGFIALLWAVELALVP